MNRFEFEIRQGPAGGVKLSKVVLVYSGDGSAFATVHDIETGAGAPVILPGRAMTPLAVARLARQLSRGRSEDGFIPAALLYRRLDAIAWWQPPARRRIWFRCEQLGAAERSEEVPHPGLVFAVDRRKWFVWAVRGKERPEESTPLYQAPYFNVYSSGAICQGNVTVPSGASSDTIDAWTEAFFRSYFTHPNVHQSLVDHPGGAFQFWRDLLDGRCSEFPENALLPLDRTLGDVLGGAAA